MIKTRINIKSFAIIIFTLSLVALLFVVTFTKSEDVFNAVFLLYSNLSTAVFAYYYSEQDDDRCIVEDSF